MPGSVEGGAHRRDAARRRDADDASAPAPEPTRRVNDSIWPPCRPAWGNQRIGHDGRRGSVHRGRLQHTGKDREGHLAPVGRPRQSLRSLRSGERTSVQLVSIPNPDLPRSGCRATDEREAIAVGAYGEDLQPAGGNCLRPGHFEGVPPHRLLALGPGPGPEPEPREQRQPPQRPPGQGERRPPADWSVGRARRGGRPRRVSRIGERRAELRGGGESIRRQLFQRPFYRRRHVGRHGPAVLRDRRRFLGHDLHDDLLRRGAHVRWIPGQHLVEHAARANRRRSGR